MEVLDEFDSELPLSVTFCQLISEEDFERQAAIHTERALRRLFRTLDRNPALAERVMRRGKQVECEQRGLFSFLWAKFISAVQGDLNHCNSMGALEMHRRLEQMKRRILRVHLYSQDAKRKRRKPILKKPEPIVLQDRSTSPCPSPPSQPPPVNTMSSVVASSPPAYTMPRVFGPFPTNTASSATQVNWAGFLNSQMTGGKPGPFPRVNLVLTLLPMAVASSLQMEKLDISRSEVKLTWNGLSSNPKSHLVDLTPLVLNPGGFHFSYLAGNSAPKLHCPGFPWTSACNGPTNAGEIPRHGVRASIFSPPVLLKFKPVSKPKDDSENDPGSAESTPPKRSQ